MRGGKRNECTTAPRLNRFLVKCLEKGLRMAGETVNECCDRGAVTMDWHGSCIVLLCRGIGDHKCSNVRGITFIHRNTGSSDSSLT